MSTEFDAHRAAAWRAALIEHVAASRPRRRMRAAVVLVAVGVLGGAGASTAAFAASGALGGWTSPARPAGQPVPDTGAAVDAPEGVLPGAPIVVMLGQSVASEVAGPTVIPLPDRAAGATHLRVTVTARAAGSLRWGLDPSGDTPSSAWAPGDIGTPRATAWYDFPLDDTQDALTLTPAGGADVLVVMQYVSQIPTRLGVNAAGETYGVDGGPSGSPDLVAVTGTDDAGRPVDGYARRVDLFADSPTATAPPAIPEEALQRQAERERDVPDGWDIPVFASDGTTRIGVFRVG